MRNYYFELNHNFLVYWIIEKNQKSRTGVTQHYGTAIHT